MNYDRTKVDPLKPELDKDGYPESDEFRARRNKLLEATYKICEAAKDK